MKNKQKFLYKKTRLENAFEMYERGQFKQAEVIYRKILQSQQKNFEALQMLGTINLHNSHFISAIDFFNQAILIKSDCPETFYNCAIAWHHIGRYEEAVQNYTQAILIKSDYVEALNNRGIALFSLERYEEALESYNQSLVFNPLHSTAYYNRGIALRKLKRNEEALESYSQAIAIKPNYSEAFYNQAMIFTDLKDYEKALESYNQAIAIKPDYAEAHWNESLCRLLLGDFELGWKKYEWRWKNEFFTSQLRNFKEPLWLGKENLQGKTILLYSEQGLGDTIQFCRYVKEVKKLGAIIILEVQSSLKMLLANLDGISTVIARGDVLPDFDYHCPILSLPLVFKLNVNDIEGIQYLNCDSKKLETWKLKLHHSTKFKVGLVWRGNPAHQDDSSRSIPLEHFSDFTNCYADFYCLQKELQETEVSTLDKSKIYFFNNELNDFSDTAALIELMDLIITIDTSVAHLAGAMGKKVWILLPFNSDWRWFINRCDSPWYNSAKLFRQDAMKNWSNVISIVTEELRELCTKQLLKNNA